MHTSSSTWANNKSTGPDGISHEAAKALLGDDVWKHRLLYTLDDFFYVAKIPEAQLQWARHGRQGVNSLLLSAVSPKWRVTGE